MPHDDYPNDADLETLAQAHATLSRYGLLPGTRGFDVPTLAAEVYAIGWAYNIDRLGAQYRVTLRPGTRDLHAFQVVEESWSADAAMALALAKCLPRMSAKPEVAEAHPTHPSPAEETSRTPVATPDGS